jgi:hypothetical protein
MDAQCFDASFCLAVLVSFGSGTASSLNAGRQNRDEQVQSEMQKASREVVKTAPTEANRFESRHLILYIDKGLLTTDVEQKFSVDLEKGFVAASDYLRRTFDASKRGVKFMIQRAGVPAMVRLYEEHFDGTRSIEDDVKRVTGKDLAMARRVARIPFRDALKRTRSE